MAKDTRIKSLPVCLRDSRKFFLLDHLIMRHSLLNKNAGEITHLSPILPFYTPTPTALFFLDLILAF